MNEMERFYLAGGEVHPEILLDPDKGYFLIQGRSVPEDGKQFYEPVLNWLEEYSSHPAEQTVIDFKLDFFNISSSKMLLFILYRLNEMQKNGHPVKINWFYRDEEDEMLEVGEDYAFMVEVPFEFVRSTPMEAS